MLFAAHHTCVFLYTSFATRTNYRPVKRFDKRHCTRGCSEFYKSNEDVSGFEGATNRISKLISNVIIYTCIPFFIECLGINVKRETIDYVLMKSLDVMHRLDKLVGINSSFSFIFDSFNDRYDVMKNFSYRKKRKWA